ncbi:MAG: hypothetical protein D6762_00280 [Candidatus Neomarinimicrobiota bacterium]|nr:MAG: hypothetical protein D6762_00280 [Candidatus Neomarinimicrobiota bacterium]
MPTPNKPGTGPALRPLSLADITAACTPAEAEELSRLFPPEPFSAGGGEDWLRLAKSLQSRGYEDLALKACRTCLQFHPTFVPAYLELTEILFRRKRWDQAIQGLEIANRLLPGNGKLEGKLALAYHYRQEYGKAQRWIHQAITHEPDNPELYNLLGLIAIKQGQFEVAEIALKKGLALAPDSPRLYDTLASLAINRGEWDPALHYTNRALSLVPDFPESLLKQAIIYLTTGQVRRGWELYEHRFELNSITIRKPPGSEWKGENLRGTRLLVWMEQGLGDAIQYFRYVKALHSRGARVSLVVRKPLVPLFRNHPWLDRVIPEQEPLPVYDFHLSVMSLPRFFESDVRARRVEVPYLFPEESTNGDLLSLIQQLKAENRPTVGLAWSGNPDHRNDHNRSLKESLVAPLVEFNRCRFLLFQFDREILTPALNRFPNAAEILGHYGDTAALLQHLDLLISVDTSICHLAGALGRPVWVLLPFPPDFRWGLDQSTTEYYPTMRLFRQRKRGDWPTVIREVKQALEHRYSTGDSCSHEEPRD